MQRTSFAARAISARTHIANASPLAAALATRLRRNRSAEPHSAFTAQGFAITVTDAETLAIETGAGCNLQVIGGRAWITAEGAREDVFADARSNVPLGSGARFNVSALRDTVTVVVTLPANVRDARFAMRVENGVRTLRLETGRRPLVAAWRRLVALIADVESRLFAPPRLVPARPTR